MIAICDFHGQTIKRSRNLRGVLEYARDHEVTAVRVDPAGAADYDVQATFFFAGGASAETRWQDRRVMLEWLATRRNAMPAKLAFRHDTGGAWLEEPRAAASLAAFHKRGGIVVRLEQ